MVLYVGDFDPAEAKQLITSYFSRLEAENVPDEVRLSRLVPEDSPASE